MTVFHKANSVERLKNGHWDDAGWVAEAGKEASALRTGLLPHEFPGPAEKHTVARSRLIDSEDKPSLFGPIKKPRQLFH